MASETSAREYPDSVSRGLHLDLGGLAAGADGASARSLQRTQALLGSLLLHVFVIAGLLVVPLLRERALPDPTHGLDALLVIPQLAPPAPPPPAPRAAAPRAAQVQPPASTKPAAFIAPVAIPDTLPNAADLDLGLQGGAPGGVEGGVAGGVVGGIVGGVLDVPRAQQPLRVGREVSEPRKLVNVNPLYPELARLTRVQGTVLIDCLIDAQGRVVDAHVLDGVPPLSEAALDAVRLWRYTPTLYGGVPVPIQMTVTVRFRLP